MKDDYAAITRGSIFAEGKAKPCIIRLTSGTEACLAVYAPERLPDSFRLYIQATRSEVDCVVTWRGRKEVGVRFSEIHGARQDDDTVESIWPDDRFRELA